MSLDHHVDLEERLITVSGQGGFSDARDSAERLLSMDGCADFSLLFLISKSWMPDSSEMYNLEEWLRLLRSRFSGRIAFAATVVGQMTPAILLSLTIDDGSNQVRAFSDERDARAWLTSAR